MAGEQPRRDALPLRERMAARKHRVHAVLHQLLHIQLRVGNLSGGDAEIDRLRLHQRRDALAHGVAHHELHAGVIAPEARDDRRQQGGREGGQTGQPHDAALLRRQIAGIRHDGIQFAEHAAEGRQQIAAERGEIGRAGVPVEHARAQTLLKLADLHRQRGLGEVQRAGRLGEAAEIGDGDEAADLAQGHSHKERLSPE